MRCVLVQLRQNDAARRLRGTAECTRKVPEKAKFFARTGNVIY